MAGEKGRKMVRSADREDGRDEKTRPSPHKRPKHGTKGHSKQDSERYRRNPRGGGKPRG